MITVNPMVRETPSAPWHTRPLSSHVVRNPIAARSLSPPPRAQGVRNLNHNEIGILTKCKLLIYSGQCDFLLHLLSAMDLCYINYIYKIYNNTQMRQGHGFKSSQMCSNLEELSGEWKAEEKFYELVNNEKKISAVKEGEREDAEKKLKTTTKINEVKERCSKEDEHERYECTRGNDRHGYCHEENECKLETTSLVREHGASRNLYGAQGEFIYVENDLKSRVAQNGSKGKEKSEELMPMSKANKKQNANHAHSVVVDIVKTDLLRSNHTEGENRKFKDSIGAVVSEVTHGLFDALPSKSVEFNSLANGSGLHLFLYEEKVGGRRDEEKLRLMSAPKE